MKHLKSVNVLAIVVATLLLCSFVTVSTAENVPPTKNIFAESPLVHILGPSPAISPSADRSAVDSGILESSDVLKEPDGTWYWYYHAQSKDKERWPEGYRICVATSKDPLGPWERYENNPVLDHGKEGVHVVLV